MKRSTLKSVIIFMIVTFLFANHIMGQINKHAEITNEVTKRINGETNEVFYEISGYDYGNWQVRIINTSDYNYFYTRKAYKFYLTDIPNEAYNINAYLEAYYKNYSTGSAKIVLLADNINFNSSQGVFDGVGSGSDLFDVDNNHGKYRNYTSLISSKRSQGYINIGVIENYSDFCRGYISLALKVTYNLPFSMIAINDMNGYSGGIIGVNNISPHPASPHTIPDQVPGDNINLLAIENQSHSGYNYIWNDTEAPNKKSEWRRKKENSSIQIATTQSTTYTVASNDNGANLVGYLRNVCNLTFTNNYSAISETGSIKVNGSTVSAPTSQYSVIEGNTILIEAIGAEYYDVRYDFSHWSDGNTENPRTITASSHYNFTAIFVGTPLFTNFGISNRNLHSNTYILGTQQFITLYWNKHQSPNVTQYKIRRGANINGVTEWHIISTVSGSTTSFSDYDFDLATKYTGSTILYDVYAYYSPDQTLSANEAITVYGNYAAMEKIVNSDSTLADLPAIKEYALSANYPNPFNPSTQISYQIPENSL